MVLLTLTFVLLRMRAKGFRFGNVPPPMLLLMGGGLLILVVVIVLIIKQDNSSPRPIPIPQPAPISEKTLNCKTKYGPRYYWDTNSGQCIPSLG